MYTSNHVFSQFFILFSLSENNKIHVEFCKNDDDTILRNNFHEFLNVPISGHYKIKQSKKGLVVLFYECILYIDIKNKYIYNICQMALPLKRKKPNAFFFLDVPLSNQERKTILTCTLFQYQ